MEHVTRLELWAGLFIHTDERTAFLAGYWPGANRELAWEATRSAPDTERDALAEYFLARDLSHDGIGLGYAISRIVNGPEWMETERTVFIETLGFNLAPFSTATERNLICALLCA